MDDWHSCYDVAVSPEHLSDLQMAHGPPDRQEGGQPIPPEELESLWNALDERFAHRTEDDQIRFLNDLPADEAALVLERANQQLQDRLLQLLPSDLSQAIANVWKHQDRVSISA